MRTTGSPGETSPAFTAPFQKTKLDGTAVYKNEVKSVIQTGDPPTLIRNYLEAQYDGNAFFVLGGPATNLAAALDFPGIKELIAAKIKYLVVAAGAFPDGPAEAHIKADISAARRVFAEWPSPIVASGYEVGAALEFPGASIDKEFAAATPDNPVADAYRVYQPMPYDAPSWDMAAALNAARPKGGYFSFSGQARSPSATMAEPLLPFRRKVSINIWWPIRRKRRRSWRPMSSLPAQNPSRAGASPTQPTPPKRRSKSRRMPRPLLVRSPHLPSSDFPLDPATVVKESRMNMRPINATALAVVAGVIALAQAPRQQTPNPNSQYRLGPDSMPQEGVPKGEIRGPFTLPSKVFPGTQHTYWVYVPAQYDPSVPASLMILQDGQAWKAEDGDLRAQNVMDNLIYRREVPVMIGVFINPGRTPEQPEPTPRDWGDRTTNRPTEYNTPDDRYARVIVDELMPVLYGEYNISRDPDQHGIGGASSGAIAAFAVAWERPDDFRKVLSVVGSFVNIRGGYVYPERVLASEKKPLRVFLCDGRNDNRGVGRGGTYDEKRDWFFQNVRLMKALSLKGYDVNYTWGMNLHGQKFGGAILPEMMRWLWRDNPVSTDPNDMVERGFREPAARKTAEAPQNN
jgi:enterochelin esterase-like enzyme